VVDCYITEALESGARKDAQTALHGLGFVTRDEFIRGPIARRFDLNPLRIMQPYLANEHLDKRWRENTLARMIGRLKKRI
jgi:hypothetical protein